MNTLNYILEDKKAIPEPDFLKWAEWFEVIENRIVATDFLPLGVMISTVFLGIDHSFLSDSDPILFETMIFGGEFDGYQERYSTWEQAEEGHKKLIELIFTIKQN